MLINSTRHAVHLTGEEMPRPKKHRRISNRPEVSFFKPQGVPLSCLNIVTLGYDELEAVKLADYENLSQQKGAESMNISRATFGRIVSDARRKIATALIRGNAIRIEGGRIEVHPTPVARKRKRCRGQRRK